MEELIRRLPKTELHVHIEGTFEPELMFRVAQRNGIEIPYSSIEELKEAYNFGNLQDFLDIYYEGAKVLIHEADFYELTLTYLETLHQQNVTHVELFFDPQTHTDRGIAFDTVLNGITRAMEDGEKKWGISSYLIMCFLRHLKEEAAMKTLEMALPYKDKILGVGLDSSELGFPPSLFERVFQKARDAGFLTVAHAGEEGPAEYIWEALELLEVARIDHGNRCLDDQNLVEELADRQIPLTLCPLSNLKLKVVEDLKEHPVRKMLNDNLLVTINSDDPAYFGGGVNENYLQTAEALQLTGEEILQLVRNSFIASFLPEAKKEAFLEAINEVYAAHNGA